MGTTRGPEGWLLETEPGGGAEAFRLEAEACSWQRTARAAGSRQEGRGQAPEAGGRSLWPVQGVYVPRAAARGSPMVQQKAPWDTWGLGKVVRPYVLPGGVPGLLRLKGLDQGYVSLNI